MGAPFHHLSTSQSLTSLGFFFLTSYCPSLASWQKWPNPLLKRLVWLGRGLAVVCHLSRGECSPSRSCSGIACPPAVLAERLQPQEHDFYSIAFLCRAFSRKIPWDTFYIAVSCLSVPLYFFFLNSFFFFFPLRKEVQPRRWSERELWC